MTYLYMQISCCNNKGGEWNMLNGLLPLMRVTFAGTPVNSIKIRDPLFSELARRALALPVLVDNTDCPPRHRLISSTQLTWLHLI